MKKLTLLISILMVLCLANNTWAGASGHWKFDEGSGTTAKDSSGKNNNGRLVNGPTWVTGQLNKALKFDGVDDYVDVPHSASLNPTTGKVTIAAWINAVRHRGPTGDDWQGVMAKGGSPRIYSLYTEASASLHFSTGPSGAYIGTLSTGKIPVNEWVHVAAVVDGEHRYYINGEPAGVGGTGAVVPTGSTANLTIGRTDESSREFQGMIDDVWVFDEALSAETIKALFNGNPPRWPKAVNPNPADGAKGVTMALFQWGAGDSARFHNLYLGTTPDLGPANLVGTRLPNTMYFHMASPLVPGTTYYWRVDEIEADMTTIWTGDVWSFTVTPLTAYQPVPADGAMYQDPNVDLAWAPGQNAFTHEVFFGANRDDVANGAAAASKGSMALAGLELPLMSLETTYYWRVDETDAMGNKQVGPVWSFTTTIPSLGKAKRELWMNSNAGTTIADIYADSRYPGSPTDVNEMPDFESPASSPDLNNYVGRLSAWLHVPVAGEYTFWIAADDQAELFLGPDPDSATVIASVATWTDAQQWDKEPSQKSKSIALEAGRYYLMAHWKDGTGGDNCAAAWQGAGIPTRELIRGSYLMPFEALWAYGPRPRNNDVNTPQTLELKWTGGTKATSHRVYFSEDANAVANGTVSPREQALEDTLFDPGALEFGKTYYWRVDEINPAEAGSPWVGVVWKFTTANYIVVDDFESYVDDVEGRIFQTWIDGWGYTEPAPGNPGNGTGSAVGYGSAPFAERTIVRGGRQSMPLAYNNADSPFYSETDRTFDTPQNWTLNDMNTLSLQIRGYPEVNNVTVTETGGKMSLTGDGADIWGATDEFTYAYKSLSGDATIVAKVASVGTGANTWAKGGVMIRASLEGNSQFAMMVMTGSAGNGGVFQNRATAGLDMSANDATSNTAVAVVIAPPYWVKLERAGDTFSGYVSQDGNLWTIVSTQEVVMTNPVYIGLCVTSHQPGEQRTFQFESIKTTGSVTGAWQGAVIDSPRYNSPQSFYVAVQDSANKVAVVKDAAVVNSADWVEVQMPLSRFTGVSMTKVKKMFIGVGDRDNAVADGTGMLFIDDIRVIKPAPAGQ